jgi:uncharacterized protein YjbI with pentapeptide repeats
MNEHTTERPPSPPEVTQKDEMEQASQSSWRTEPEISQRRKDVLRKCLDSVRYIKPDIRRVKEGKYPFKGMKLTRADVIFLLSVHEDWQGSVEGSDLNQPTPKGLDLRGANLQGVDLGGLHLDYMLAGLTEEEWFIATPGQCKMATTNLDDANFAEALLQGATFCYAHLRRANFSKAWLKDADLFGADLRGASFYKTALNGANLYGANLEGAKVSKAEFEQAGVDANVLKEVVVQRTVVPPWGAGKTKLPLTPDWLYHEYKSPRWLTGFSKTLMIPLLLALITLLVTQAFDYISQKRQAEQAQQALLLQSKQTELQLKNNLLVKMSNTVANALTELNLIQNDQESNDVTVALKNYDDGFRNLLVNGSEIEAELRAYFPQGHSCTNMSDNITKDSDAPFYKNIINAWNNYDRVVLNNFYDLESNRNMYSRKNGDIQYIQDVFYIYGIDKYIFIWGQQPMTEDDWNNISVFHPIQKYKNKNGTNLVIVGVNPTDPSSVWNNLEQIIDGYKSIIVQCLLDSKIPALSVTPTPS